MRAPECVVLIFVDGLGWGADDPNRNPCLDYGGHLFDFDRHRDICRPIDACLDVDGLPQSATGQTALLTGVNAPKRLGHHQTGFPTPTLRKILLEHSIFSQLADRGLDGIFINAFRPLFFEMPREAQLKLSATTVAHMAADRPFFDLDDIAAGRSIYQEFTNRELIERGFDVPELTAAQAAGILIDNVPKRDFTLFEYFQTDRAGHSRDRDRINAILRDLDTFVATVVDGLPHDALVLLTSDHGNIEDIETRSHTRNPVPLMAWGPGARRMLETVRDLTDVTPAIVDLLTAD